MLKIKHEENLSRPIICCDMCQGEITSAGSAMVYWNDNVDGAFKVVVACKGCEAGTKFTYSMELSTFLVFLLNNCGLHGRKLREAQQKAGIVKRAAT